MNYQNKNKCLLLNTDYTPVCLADWKKSIIWSIRSKENASYPIEILKYSHNYIVDCKQNQFFLPSVAKTKRYFNLYSRDISFSRKNLFIRDNHTCQYCGVQYPFSQLTYDHVIPKSRYKNSDPKNSTNWNNVVTACIKCNRIKGNKTPEEANMILKNKPYKPKYNKKYLRWYSDLITMNREECNQEWKDFLIYESYF